MEETLEDRVEEACVSNVVKPSCDVSVLLAPSQYRKGVQYLSCPQALLWDVGRVGGGGGGV